MIGTKQPQPDKGAELLPRIGLGSSAGPDDQTCAHGVELYFEEIRVRRWGQWWGQRSGALSVSQRQGQRLMLNPACKTTPTLLALPPGARGVKEFAIFTKLKSLPTISVSLIDGVIVSSERQTSLSDSHVNVSTLVSPFSQTHLLLNKQLAATGEFVCEQCKHLKISPSLVTVVIYSQVYV